MPIHVYGTVPNPEEIQIEIRMKMSLGEWEKVADQLGARWPGSEISRYIGSVVSQMRRNFTPKEDHNGNS